MSLYFALETVENNKNKKSVKFQGDMLNFYDFIQVYVFTTNHHLKYISAHSLKPHPRKMPHATRRISSARFDVFDAFTSAYTTLSVLYSIAIKSEQK